MRRFYGGNLEEWLDMPMALWNEHARQLPALQAREALLASTVAALGGGHMKPQAQREVLRAWRREAGLDQGKKPRSRDEWEQQAAAFGIPVMRAPWPVKKS